MKFRFGRLQAAALVVAACVISPAMAIDGMPIVLQWTPPAANDDGSELANLAGYYIYTGTSPDNLIPTYFASATIPAIVLRYPLGELHYFGVTAVNVNGVESTMTAIVSNLQP